MIFPTTHYYGNFISYSKRDITRQLEVNSLHHSPVKPEAEAECSRKGLWDILRKTGDDAPAEAIIEQAPEAADQESPGSQPATPPAPPAFIDARELPEAKILNQLTELAHLLSQQTTLLYAQQKLLEDLAGRQKQTGKAKPVVAKKLKNLLHKGKLFWNTL